MGFLPASSFRLLVVKDFVKIHHTLEIPLLLGIGKLVPFFLALFGTDGVLFFYQIQRLLDETITDKAVGIHGTPPSMSVCV